MVNERPEAIQPLRKRKLWIRPLIYGHPGAGKSPVAGSTAILGKTLILNADGPDGPESMRKSFYWKEYGDNIEIWDVDNIKDLHEARDYFRRGTGTTDFSWVWLDSVTLFEESDMDSIMRDLVKGKSHRDIHLPDKPQYMLRQNHVGLWVRDMRKLKINFGMTAHVMSVGVDDEDEEASTVSYRPAIQGGQGQLSSKICGYFGLVGRMYVRRTRVRVKGGGRKTRTERVLQVQPSAKWYAKDRLSGDALGAEIVGQKISMADIVEVIRPRRKTADGN